MNPTHLSELYILSSQFTDCNVCSDAYPKPENSQNYVKATETAAQTSV